MTVNFGEFSEDGREYVIHTPNTPRPWINYLTNGDYCALSSHVGGGFSFFRDHRFNGVLKRDLQQSQNDLTGRFVYLKDEESGEVWTANVHPIGKFDTFEARHGIGYTRIKSSYNHIFANLRYFVGPEADAELWTIHLENRSHKTLSLSVYSLAEFSLGNISLYEGDVNFHSLFNKVEMNEYGFVASHNLWFPKYGWSEDSHPWKHRVFLTTTQRPDKITTDRSAFFGPFRSVVNPRGVEGEYLPQGSGGCTELVGVCQWRIQLAPGAVWSVNEAIGMYHASAGKEPQQIVEKFQFSTTYENSWKAHNEHWARLLSSVEVETPDLDINIMMNVWNKWQLFVNFYFGRAPSYFHKGQYPGMRDCCQDVFGVIPLSRDLAKANLRRIGGFFFRDGQATGGCNRIGLKEDPSLKVDLPLWFVLAVADYLRETGDIDFLNESLPLMDEGSSTIYEKMIMGIERIVRQQGPHGLPLIGKGDWNDAANAVGEKGQGESVWLAEFLCHVICEIAPLMHLKNDAAKLIFYEKRAKELKKIINAQCWDGEWFVRAFRDDGRPLGVKGEKEGYIWINSQTWAVIADIADAERLNTCLDSVEKHLGTPYGLTNLAPAYTKYDHTIGLITGFKAGWKENGAVFSHASSFNVVARAIMGRGWDAVDLFRRILPSSKESDHYLVEPYIYSQFCAGPDAGAAYGQGAYHWLTGTAAWMFRAMTDYIIGVHPELYGLRIRPAVDPSWKSFTMKRLFREATYMFRFENPDGVETGVRQIYLDDQLIDGTLLPLPTQKQHHVRVVMG